MSKKNRRHGPVAGHRAAHPRTGHGPQPLGLRAALLHVLLHAVRDLLVIVLGLIQMSVYLFSIEGRIDEEVHKSGMASMRLGAT